jgi:hypothetical protein
VAKWEAGALVVPKMAAILLRLYEQLMGGEDATR